MSSVCAPVMPLRGYGRQRLPRMRVVRPPVCEEEPDVDGDADNGSQQGGHGREQQFRGDNQRSDEHERDQRPKEHSADADFEPNPHDQTVPLLTTWWPEVGQELHSTGARARVTLTSPATRP